MMQQVAKLQNFLSKDIVNIKMFCGVRKPHLSVVKYVETTDSLGHSKWKQVGSGKVLVENRINACFILLFCYHLFLAMIWHKILGHMDFNLILLVLYTRNRLKSTEGYFM